MSAIQYRPDIDGLRAVAVLGVVLFHVSPAALPGGFLGVDIFFVISGYLISLIVFREQTDGNFSFRNFYVRRIRRLFPALSIVVFATLALGAFALFADEYERLGRHALYAIGFMLNFRLMGEAGYFDVTTDAKPLVHLWSLSVEEQFYLAWPILLLGVRQIGLPRGVVLVVLGAASFAFAIHLADSNVDALYYHPFARFWELIIGAAVAWWHHRRASGGLSRSTASSRIRNMISLSGLGVILWSLFALDKSMLHPGPATLVPLLAVAAVIASGTQARANRLLAIRPLVWVGLISYPLYLWHWPLLSYLRIMSSGTPPVWTLWGAALVAVVLAWATYEWIERPIRDLRARRRVVASLVAVMGGLLIASRSVVAGDGLPDRSAIRYMKEADAQMQREPRQDDDCLLRFPAGSAPIYCRERQAGGQRVAVLGDSHAHVLFPGVAELAAQKGYGTLLLANSGCPPFEGAVTGRNAREKRECAQHIETILSAVERDDRIVAVILASRGPQYLDGKGFGPAEASYDYPPISARQAIDSSIQISPEDAFMAGLRATVDRLNRQGIRVAYLLQVPELGMPARDCLERPLALATSAPGCAVPYREYRLRMSTYRSLIGALHSADQSLSVVDPESLFCMNGSCSGSRDGRLFYVDDNHLSVLGSRRVAPLVLLGLGL